MPKSCTKINPGKFDKRITIQTNTQTSDSQGGYTDSWANSKTVWASIKPVSGFQKFQAHQMETPISHEVLMRYDSNLTLTPANRFTYDSRTFNIVEVINIEEKNQYWKLKALEGTAT